MALSQRLFYSHRCESLNWWFFTTNEFFRSRKNYSHSFCCVSWLHKGGQCTKRNNENVYQHSWSTNKIDNSLVPQECSRVWFQPNTIHCGASREREMYRGGIARPSASQHHTVRAHTEHKIGNKWHTHAHTHTYVFMYFVRSVCWCAHPRTMPSTYSSSNAHIEENFYPGLKTGDSDKAPMGIVLIFWLLSTPCKKFHVHP